MYLLNQVFFSLFLTQTASLILLSKQANSWMNLTTNLINNGVVANLASVVFQKGLFVSLYFGKMAIEVLTDANFFTMLLSGEAGFFIFYFIIILLVYYFVYVCNYLFIDFAYLTLLLLKSVK